MKSMIEVNHKAECIIRSRGGNIVDFCDKLDSEEMNILIKYLNNLMTMKRFIHT